MMRDRRISCLLLAAALLAIVGCGPFFGLPSICEPGSESQKLADAKKFDPYPDPNMGPAVVGGRPEGFMHPRPDPDITKLPLPPWAQSYPPVAASYPATGSYYPSAMVVTPPATAAYPPPASPYVAPANPSVVPPISSVAPAAAPALVPLNPPPASAVTPDGRTTGAPKTSYGSTAEPVAYGTKFTAP